MTPPSLRFLFAHPAHFIACGLGSGLSPFAPGTVGTLFAWTAYPLLRLLYPADANFALFLGFMFILGFWCCQLTGRHLGVPDHGAIVWDEIVPFWIVLLFTPHAWTWQLTSFVLFRCYDIIKLPPAHWFDQRFKNGFGVMMDALAAAGQTLFTLALIRVLVDLRFW